MLVFMMVGNHKISGIGRLPQTPSSSQVLSEPLLAWETRTNLCQVAHLYGGSQPRVIRGGWEWHYAFHVSVAEREGQQGRGSSRSSRPYRSGLLTQTTLHWVDSSPTGLRGFHVSLSPSAHPYHVSTRFPYVPAPKRCIHLTRLNMIILLDLACLTS
jgi:hypothetical protein